MYLSFLKKKKKSSHHDEKNNKKEKELKKERKKWKENKFFFFLFANVLKNLNTLTLAKNENVDVVSWVFCVARVRHTMHIFMRSVIRGIILVYSEA